MIDTTRPYALFAKCSVIYDGRATSTLPSGNYVVMRKADGSMSIHGSTLNTPRNYMGCNAQCTLVNDTFGVTSLVFTLKKEMIKVKIENIISLMYLDDWSDNPITISRTEKELSKKIYDNWGEYFEGEYTSVMLEHQTEVGVVDVMGITIDSHYSVVEVKRKTATLAAVSQLRRYVEYFSSLAGIKSVDGCLAAPSISPNALKHLVGFGYRYLQIDFD